MKVNFFRVTTGTMFATIAAATSLRQTLDKVAAMAENAMPDLYLSQVDSTADTEASLLGATSPMMSFDWGFDSMDQQQHLAQTDNLAEANKVHPRYKNPPKMAPVQKPVKIEAKKLAMPAKGSLKAKQQKITAKQKQID